MFLYFQLCSCDYTDTIHTHRHTHAHAVRQAADLLVLTEAQEVTIRLERQWGKLGGCVFVWMCVCMHGGVSPCWTRTWLSVFVCLVCVLNKHLFKKNIKRSTEGVVMKCIKLNMCLFVSFSPFLNYVSQHDLCVYMCVCVGWCWQMRACCWIACLWMS